MTKISELYTRVSNKEMFHKDVVLDKQAMLLLSEDDGPFTLYLNDKTPELTFTKFSWSSFWREVFNYPPSGVSNKRLSNTLVKSIFRELKASASTRITRVAKCYIDETGERCYLRGLSPATRVAYSNKALIRALSHTKLAKKVTKATPILETDPSSLYMFETETLSVNDTEVISGFMLSNSDVVSAPAHINTFLSFKDTGALFCFNRQGRSIFRIRQQHKNALNLIEDLNTTLLSSETALISTIQKMENTKNGPSRDKVVLLQNLFSRFNITKTSQELIDYHFSKMIGSGELPQSKWGLGCALATLPVSPQKREEFSLIAGELVTSNN